jgi:UDP-glucuronate 4-epimerase
MKILVTGSAGFIGHHLSKDLLEDGHEIVGLDSLNDYYDPLLKQKRNDLLSTYEKYRFQQAELSDHGAVSEIVDAEHPELIIHLAAQAGVRYSLVNPWVYEQSNTLGTISIFEAARKAKIKRVIFASSSSVYGANTKIPFSESDVTDSPVSLYAATKKSCELIARTYHHLYGIEVAGLRFFTVYGELYRPDMALFSFAKNILLDQPIKLFNNGKMKRDYTFISDIVDGIKSAAFKEQLGFEIYNLGGDNPVDLERVVALLEHGLQKQALVEYLPMQAGDVEITYADISKAKKEIGFSPKVRIEEGIARFCTWFLANKEWLLKLKDAK